MRQCNALVSLPPRSYLRLGYHLREFVVESINPAVIAKIAMRIGIMLSGTFAAEFEIPEDRHFLIMMVPTTVKDLFLVLCFLPDQGIIRTRVLGSPFIDMMMKHFWDYDVDHCICYDQMDYYLAQRLGFCHVERDSTFQFDS